MCQCVKCVPKCLACGYQRQALLHDDSREARMRYALYCLLLLWLLDLPSYSPYIWKLDSDISTLLRRTRFATHIQTGVVYLTLTMAAPPPRPTIGLNGTSTANVSGPMSSSADLAQPARPVSSQGGPSAPQTTALTEAQKEEQERLAEMKEKKKKEREELLMKKDKSMGELLLMLDDYQPLVRPQV
jgi:hypothetical protein